MKERKFPLKKNYDHLIGYETIIIAHRDKIIEIYGPGVDIILKDVKVKIENWEIGKRDNRLHLRLVTDDGRKIWYPAIFVELPEEEEENDSE